MTIDPELLKNLPAGSVVIIIPDSQASQLKEEPEYLSQPETVKPAKIPNKKKLELKEVEGKEVEVKHITGEVREGVRYFTKEGKEFFSVYDFIIPAGYGDFKADGMKRPHNVWNKIMRDNSTFAGDEERHMFTTNRFGQPISVRQTTPCLPSFRMSDLEQILFDKYGEPDASSTEAEETVQEKEEFETPLASSPSSNVVEFAPKPPEDKKPPLEVVRVEKPAPYVYGNYTFNTPQEVAAQARRILNSLPKGKTGYFLEAGSNDYLFMKSLIEKAPMGQGLIAAKGAVKAIQVSRHTDGASNHFRIYLGNRNFSQTIALSYYLPSAQTQRAPSIKKEETETVRDIIAGIF